ncbi:hypothetical protein [Acidisoma cellulosilyticum]|nr:hypothetical protein [Acidisoma cellulosilyticum]
MTWIGAQRAPGTAIAVLSILYILILVALLTLIPEQRGVPVAG